MIKHVDISDIYLTHINATIKDALNQIDKAGVQFTVVVNDDNILVGTLTDGDVRRALISGAKMNSNVVNFANKDFIFVRQHADLESVRTIMSSQKISQVPIIDFDGKVIGIYFREFDAVGLNNKVPIFLLAGGLGTRLHPLTKDYPKPLIEVGGRPILEHIISEFSRQGFTNIIVSLNFKANLIKEHFKDGEKWGVNITYVEEKKRLGTAGSLSLISDKIFDNIVVMNGDLLTHIDFNQLLNFHVAQGSDLTICSRAYTHQVPFGVLNCNDLNVLSVDEKPIITKMISMGVYVLGRRCFEALRYNSYCDMPDLIERLIQKELRVKSFEVLGDWIDIGRLADLTRARELSIDNEN